MNVYTPRKTQKSQTKMFTAENRPESYLQFMLSTVQDKETKSSWDYQVPSWETNNHWKEEKKHKFK